MKRLSLNPLWIIKQSEPITGKRMQLYREIILHVNTLRWCCRERCDFQKKSLELYLFISKSTVSVVAEYLSRSSRVLEKCCLLTIPVQNNTKFQRRMVQGNFRALGVKLLKSFLHRLKTEVTKEEFSHSLGGKN